MSDSAEFPGQKGLADLRVLCGPPKLAWRASRHPNPNAQCRNYRISLCGEYSLYQSGEHWVARFLREPVNPSSIAIERTEAAALAWVERLHSGCA